MHTQKISKAAPLASFRSLRSPLMFGQFLTDVKQIERSIKQYGLMMPIIVSQANNQLVVVDGKKRLAAIKRMSFAGTLPRSLVKIPYIHVEESTAFERDALSGLAAQDTYSAVMALKSAGHSIDGIAEELFLCRRTVTDIISLSRLAKSIRTAFFKNVLSFDQARAYASLPHEEAQIHLLKQVGPFATANKILDVIKSKPRKAADEAAPNFVDFALYKNKVLTKPVQYPQFVWRKVA